jgi:hypothetical protein
MKGGTERVAISYGHGADHAAETKLVDGSPDWLTAPTTRF